MYLGEHHARAQRHEYTGVRYGRCRRRETFILHDHCVLRHSLFLFPTGIPSYKNSRPDLAVHASLFEHIVAFSPSNSGILFLPSGALLIRECLALTSRRARNAVPNASAYRYQFVSTYVRLATYHNAGKSCTGSCPHPEASTFGENRPANTQRTHTREKLTHVRVTLHLSCSRRDVWQLGRVGVFGGSEDFTGAPFFASMSALRMGADLAYVFTAKEAAPALKGYSPELMVSRWGEVGTRETEFARGVCVYRRGKDWCSFDGCSPYSQKAKSIGTSIASDGT